MPKSCTWTGSGCPFGRSSRPPFLKSPTSSFPRVKPKGMLLGVDRDDRLAGSLERFHPGIDVLELGVTVGMAGTFARLRIGLQAEAQPLQEAADQFLARDEA